MANRLDEYYNKYCSNDQYSNLFYDNARKWFNTIQPETVKVGGKEYTMTLTRWIKRLEKSAKSEINEQRRINRKESLRANEGKFYYTQPAMKTIPLHQDLNFLRELWHWCLVNEEWKSNDDDTVRVLVPESRAWFKNELQNLITLETIRSAK